MVPISYFTYPLQTRSGGHTSVVGNICITSGFFQCFTKIPKQIVKPTFSALLFLHRWVFIAWIASAVLQRCVSTPCRARVSKHHIGVPILRISEVAVYLLLQCYSLAVLAEKKGVPSKTWVNLWQPQWKVGRAYDTRFGVTVIFFISPPHHLLGKCSMFVFHPCNCLSFPKGLGRSHGITRISNLWPWRSKLASPWVLHRFWVDLVGRVENWSSLTTLSPKLARKTSSSTTAGLSRSFCSSRIASPVPST